MASIIIDEIVPTKWRLRLRDADGKSREVVYRTGQPLQLDGAAPDPEKGSDKPKRDIAVKTGATKPRRYTSPEQVAKPPAFDKPPAADKPRATDKPYAQAAKTAKGERLTKPEPSTEKPKPVPPPQVRRRKPEAGPGPGELVWEETEDDGVPGIRAPFERGTFKILHAGGDVYGLFYEWHSGKYQTLSCGSLTLLKETAAQRTEDGKLRPPRSNLGAEAAKLACAPKNDDAPAPTPATPPSADPTKVDPDKDRLMMQGFEATVQKLIAERRTAP